MENEIGSIQLQEHPEKSNLDAIRELFSQDKILYYSDIANELQLDLKTVVEICDALEDSGEIVVGIKMRNYLVNLNFLIMSLLHTHLYQIALLIAYSKQDFWLSAVQAMKNMRLNQLLKTA